jgi:hypothetical protein
MGVRDKRLVRNAGQRSINTAGIKDLHAVAAVIG